MKSFKKIYFCPTMTKMPSELVIYSFTFTVIDQIDFSLI